MLRKFTPILHFNLEKITKIQVSFPYWAITQPMRPFSMLKTFTIRRYDGRGVLSDLKGHEGRNTALNDNGWMTPEERTIEAMCDEERCVS